MTPLKSTWEVRVGTGDAPATIRVRNLQASIQGPGDAWGRPGKPQPISISASVTLNKAFGSSSSTDTVGADTVHYGLLSKAILSTLNDYTSDRHSSTLDMLLYAIWRDLTGLDVNGYPMKLLEREPFLNILAVRSLEISVHLPKASLLGNGVSLTKVSLFQHDADKPTESIRSHLLKIHDLRVPTLIGVNDNERLARQVVVTSIEIDKYENAGDLYHKIEEVAVKAMSESSFETLEALANHMAVLIAKFLKANCLAPEDEFGWKLKVVLEKPIAVTLADAVCVELSANTNDLLDAAV